MSQWSRSRWHDPATPRGTRWAASRFVVTATALRTVARVSLRGGVRLLRGFRVGRGDARARRRRMPSSRVASRRACFYVEKLIVARKRCRGALTELSEFQRHAEFLGALCRSHTRTCWKRTFGSFGRRSRLRTRRYQFEWCDVKQARRRRNVTVCARDRKRVVNIIINLTCVIYECFLLSWHFGWTLIRWCWIVIDIILWDQLYTVVRRMLALSEKYPTTIWFGSFDMNFYLNQNFGKDKWLKSRFEQVLFFLLAQLYKESRVNIAVRLTYTSITFSTLKTFLFFNFLISSDTRDERESLYFSSCLQFLHSKFCSSNLWMMVIYLYLISHILLNIAVKFESIFLI